MEGVMEFLRSLGPWSPVVVFLSATAESAGFVGLFVPGELMTIVGGAIAGLGDTPLAFVMFAAVGGAIAGDSIGYWIGARYGARLLERPALRRARPGFDRAGHFLESHGSWALVLARFTPMVRSLTPMAAGAAKMRYRSFALANAVGGLVWGVAVSSLGFWAGSRWETIQASFQQGMLLFVGTIALIGLGVTMTRWIARHPGEVRRRIAKLGDRPVVGRIVHLTFSSWGQPRPFLRLLPHGLVVMAFSAVLAATALIDLSYPESRFLAWLDTQISAELRNGLTSVTQWVDVRLLLIAAAVTIIATSVRRRDVSKLVALSTAVAAAVSVAVASITDREVGPVPMTWAIQGDTFPDLRAALATALVLSVAWPWFASWAEGTRRLGIGVGLSSVIAALGVGATRIYPLDAAAGVSVGAVVVVLVASWVDPRVRDSMKLTPDAPEPVSVASVTVPAAERPAI